MAFHMRKLTSILAMSLVAGAGSAAMASPSTSAASSANQSKIQGRLATSKALGGESGGGGNIKPAGPATAEQVEYAIKQSKEWLPYVINYLESAEQPPLSYSGGEAEVRKQEIRYEKLFGRDVSDASEAPIRTKIKTIRLRIEPIEPCIGPFGRKDASASKDGTICMSIAQILPQVNSENVFVKVMALMVHEASHLVDFDEVEADAIQERVGNLVRPELGMTTLPLLQGILWQQTVYLDEAIDGVLESLKNRKEKTQVCASLGALNPWVIALNDTGKGSINSYGVEVLPPKRFGYFYASLNLKVSLAVAQFCAAREPKVMEMTQTIFNRRSSVTVEDALRAITDPKTEGWLLKKQYPMTDLWVRQFHTNDRQALVAEIRESKAIVKRLQRALGR